MSFWVLEVHPNYREQVRRARGFSPNPQPEIRWLDRGMITPTGMRHYAKTFDTEYEALLYLEDWRRRYTAYTQHSVLKSIPILVTPTEITIPYDQWRTQR